MKKLILFIALLLIPSAYAVDAVELIKVNSSSLPHSTSANLTLILSENATATINQIATSSILNISFNSSVYFPNGNTTIVPFNISIKDTNTEGNQTHNATFVIGNSLNSIVFTYIISVFIVDDQPIFKEKEEFDIRVINGNYEINISSNLLPVENNLHYEISGLSGYGLNISCEGSWLTCPKNLVFSTNNKTDFNIKYIIPQNTNLGTYTYDVNLTSGNQTRHTEVTFRIKDPDLILEAYVFSEECFIEVPGQDYLTVKYECILEQEEYNVRRLSQILARSRAVQNISCEPEIETEYLIAGHIDEDVYNELLICRSERQTANNQIKSLGVDVSRLQNLNTDLQDVISKNETECLANAVSVSARLQSEAREYKLTTDKKIRNWIFGAFSTCIILVILVILGIYAKGTLYDSKWKGGI